MSFVTNPNANKLIGSLSGAATAAGNVGETAQVPVLSAAAVNLPNQTAVNVVTKLMPAGNYIFFGNCYMQSTVGVANFNSNLSTTTAALSDPAFRFGLNETASQIANGGGQCSPLIVNSSVPFTVYLVAYGVLSGGGSATVCGAITYIRTG